MTINELRPRHAPGRQVSGGGGLLAAGAKGEESGVKARGGCRVRVCGWCWVGEIAM